MGDWSPRAKVENNMTIEKQNRRQKIIEVAAKEFAEKGYDNSNINEIATLSGIGKGTIYLYFKNKKELYLATMQTVVTLFNEASKSVLALDCSPIEKLKKCIELIFTFEEEGLPFLILWSRYQFQNTPDFQEDVHEIFEELEQPFCEIVKQGVDKQLFTTKYPEEVGYIILSMVIMMIPSLQAKPLLSNVTSEEKISFIIGLINNGLSCERVN